MGFKVFVFVFWKKFVQLSFDEMFLNEDKLPMDMYVQFIFNIGICLSFFFGEAHNANA